MATNDIIAFNANDFAAASKGLRRAATVLSRRTRVALRATAKPIVDDIRQRMPHKDAKGVATSVRASATDKGVMITVKGYGYAFSQGNRGHQYYKHPVYGRWSKSSKTLMQTDPAAVEEPWQKGRVHAAILAEAVMDEAIRAVTIGGSHG